MVLPRKCAGAGNLLVMTIKNGVLTVTYDAAAHAAYIRLQPDDVVQPSVAETLTVTDSINLDIDYDGRWSVSRFLASGSSTRLFWPRLAGEATNPSPERSPVATRAPSSD